jgi:hypothetical protein
MVNFYRECDDGFGQTLFKLNTPIAGGNSIMGLYDREDEGQYGLPVDEMKAFFDQEVCKVSVNSS